MVKRKACEVDAKQPLITKLFQPINRKRVDQDAPPSQPYPTGASASEKKSVEAGPSISKTGRPNCIIQPKPTARQPLPRSNTASPCGFTMTLTGMYALGDTTDGNDRSRCTKLVRDPLQDDTPCPPSGHGPSAAADQHQPGADSGSSAAGAAKGATADRPQPGAGDRGRPVGSAPPSPLDLGAAAGAFLWRLNEEQRRAVTSDLDTPLQILAAAGTGKTTTMTARILHAIQQGVSPRHILAVTFTNRAAGELRARVREHAGDAGAYVTVQTFHSLAHTALMAFFRLLGYTKRPTVYATDAEVMAVVRKALADWYTAKRCMQLKEALASLLASATTRFDNHTITSERRRQLAEQLSASTSTDWQVFLPVVEALWPLLYHDCVAEAEAEVKLKLGKAMEREQKAEERRQKKKQKAEEKRLARNGSGGGKGKGGEAGPRAGTGAPMPAAAPPSGSTAASGDGSKWDQQQESHSARSQAAAYLRHQIMLGFMHEEVMEMWRKEKLGGGGRKQKGAPQRAMYQLQQEKGEGRPKLLPEANFEKALFPIGGAGGEGGQDARQAPHGDGVEEGEPQERQEERGRRKKKEGSSDPPVEYSPADEKARSRSQAKELKEFISYAGARGNRPEQYEASNMFGFGYARYLHHLKAANAVDFDELMHGLLVLFREQPEVGRRLRGRFRYMLVDEVKCRA